MEGGFEAERGTARPAPGFEPPVEPGSGPSLRGLSLVARIMRGRELAGDAAGIPPLDSDQVLDLQRTAGNQLTTGALARWNDLLEAGAEEQSVPHELLGQLFAARAADPALHAAICAALDGLAPQIALSVTCTGGAGGPVEVAMRGPVGTAARTAVVLAPGESTVLALGFAEAFGPATGIAPADALAVTITSAGGARQSLQLPVPFAAPVPATGYAVLAELR